ncbi:MAG: hypothetical protein QM811_15420 [Pirellulales bacterium]
MAGNYKVRFQDAEDTLEEYLHRLRKEKKFSAPRLEHDLRTCWSKSGAVTSLGFKEFILQLGEDERYKHVALYYMAHHGDAHPPTEYKASLQTAYGNGKQPGLEFGTAEYQTAEKAYWKTFAETPTDPA